MKHYFNKISRRAFLSAIGVMAATSMMTACAQTPVADKDEGITFQPQTKSLIFDDKAFVVNSVGYGITHDGYVQVDFTMVNHLDKVVEINSAEPDDGHLNLMVRAYFDGSYIPETPVNTGDDNLLEANLNPHDEDGVNISDYSLEGSVYFKEPETWSNVAVVLSLTDTIDEEDVTKEVIFTFNKV